MRKRDIRVLQAAAIWTVYVWATRMWNIWRDSAHNTSFKVVHTVLAVVSIAFAVAIWGIAARAKKNQETGVKADIA
jgi:hypothetical protein